MGRTVGDKELDNRHEAEQNIILSGCWARGKVMRRWVSYYETCGGPRKGCLIRTCSHTPHILYSSSFTRGPLPPRLGAKDKMFHPIKSIHVRESLRLSFDVCSSTTLVLSSLPSTSLTNYRLLYHSSYLSITLILIYCFIY